MREVDFYLSLPYQTRVVPDDCSDGATCYFGYVLELPGCESHGGDAVEAQANLREAMELYLSSMIEDGLEPPMPQSGGVSVVWRSERMDPQAVPEGSGFGFQPA